MKLLSELAEFSRGSKIYWWCTAGCGIATLGLTLPQLFSINLTGIVLLLTLAVVIFVVGHFPVRIPGTPCVITPGDIFIILSCLLLGTAPTTIIAALDSFYASYQSSKRWSTRLASCFISGTAMYCSASAFTWLQSTGLKFIAAANLRLFVALLIFSCLFFLLSSGLMAGYAVLRQPQPLFSFWQQNYLWLGPTYAASASFAGIIFLGLERYGGVVILAALPIVAVFFTTFRLYFKNAEEREKRHRQRIEAAEAQADLAAQHLRDMQASEERFRSAFDFAAIGMALVAPQGEWLQVNPSLCQIIGYSEKEILATNFQNFTHPEDVAAVQRAILQLLSGKLTATQIEHRFVHALGHDIWVSLNASLIGSPEAHSRRLIFQVQNITDRKKAEARLLHDAFHDALTTLPNRALFLDHLEMAIARTTRHPERAFAVLFLDFDRFKIINDSLGHLAGDEMLVEVARRLKNSVRGGDTIARLGGDEFIILLEEINNAQEAVALAQRIQTTLREPIKLSGTEITITVSIGIAYSSEHYKKPEEILRDADTAMYQAKSQGKARYALFDPSMHTRALSQLQLENDLRRAIERNEFYLEYQPIISLQSGKLVGFEALVRWQHPERGFISPGDFIAVAEETSLIIPMGHWVIEQSCRQMQEWVQFYGDYNLTVSVNLSGKQLVQDDVVACVINKLALTGLSAQHLKLEITESVVMDNVEVAIRQLNQLRALGIKLSIDDFGTGYSSLSYLHRLPTDTLKVDRSFVSRMVEHSENAEIVRTIVLLAHTLKMDVTAEGIETKDQLLQLQKLGVEYAQGYYFSKPVGVHAAAELIRRRQNEEGFFDPTGQTDQALITREASANSYTM